MAEVIVSQGGLVYLAMMRLLYIQQLHNAKMKRDYHFIFFNRSRSCLRLKNVG